MRSSDGSSDVCSSDLRPCGVALLHLVESIVDLFERYRRGDDAVEVEQPAQIEIDEPRDVDRKAVAAHDRALQFLARKQVHRTEPDLLDRKSTRLNSSH